MILCTILFASPWTDSWKAHVSSLPGASHVSQEAPGIQRHFRSVIIQLQQQCSYARWDRKCVCLGLLIRKNAEVRNIK